MLIKLSCKGDQFWFFIDIKEQIKYEVSFFYLPLHSLRKEGISWASRWPRNWRALQLYLKVRAWWGFYPITFMAYVVYASREGNGTPLQYSCLENPMDGGAWTAAVHGVAEGQTQLSDFTFTFHFHALEKEMATHSSVLAWRIPGTGRLAGLPSMGSHRVGHDWRDLAIAKPYLFLFLKM